MSSGVFNQSGGSIVVDGNDNNTAASSVASGSHLFRCTGGIPNCTAGTITVVDPPVSSYATASTRSINISLGANNNYFSGTHTFIVGDGASTTTGNTDGFVVETFSSGACPIQNLTVNGGAGAGRWGTNSYNNATNFGLFVKGTLTINSGSEFRTTYPTSGVFQVAGGVTNNGTLTVGHSGTALVLGNFSSGGYIAPSQTVVTGTGVFRNSATTPTANYTNVTINNTNGVAFSSAASISGTGTGTVSGTLVMTSGPVDLSGGTFTLGISTAALGTLTYTAGGFITGSTFRRWFAAATAGTTITASTVPTSGTGSYPFITGSSSRNFHINRPSTTGATGGIISVQYNNGAGLTTIAPVTDGAYSIDRQSLANWIVSTGGGFSAGTGTFSYAVSGQGIYTPLNTNSRLMQSAAVVGTHQTGTLLPHVQRTAIPGASAFSTYYFGINSADIATCGPPTGLSVTDITTNTADISWTPSATGTPASYDWEIRTSGAGGSGGAGLTTSGSTTPPTVSVNDVPGLTSATAYNLYVRTNCTGGDGSSSWSGPVAFTTKPACPANLGAGTVNVASIPYAVTGVTTCGNGNNVTSANAAAICGSGSYYGGEDRTYIFTPTATGVYNILLTTTTDDDASITLYQGCPFTTGSTCVGFSQSTTGLTRTIGALLTNGVTYYLVVDNFPAPACITSYSLNIDPPVACPVPTGVTAGSITTTTASISWGCLGCTGTFELDYGSSGHSAGTGTIITGVTSPYVLNPPLTPGTAYTVYVRQDCGAGLFSAWSAAANFTTLTPPPPNDLVCSATALTLDGAQDCQSTVAATSTSDPALPAVCSTPNNTVWYTYTPAVSGTVVLRLEVPGATSNGLSGWVAWYTATGVCPSLTLTPVVGSACQSFGPTAGDLDDLTSPALTGGTTYYIMIDGNSGDVGDFCIRAITPPTCIAPTGVTVGSITTTTASVSFTGAGTAYIVDYGVSPYTTPGTGAGTGAGGSGVFTGAASPIPMTGLSPSTTYQVYVRQDCTGGTGGYSINTGVVTFTTASPPPANDDATGAITLTLNGACTASPYTNVGATQGATEQFASCYQQNTTAGVTRATHTVWYKFVASPTTSVVKVTTDIAGGTLADTHVALFAVGDPADYSTFALVSCDDDNGVTGTTRSILYGSVTPGTTYYISVDGYNASTGTFCLRVDDLDGTMIATTASCATVQPPSGAQTTYTGQVPLVDANGRIVALARNPAGGRVDAYTGALNVSASQRSASGIYYLNRNYLINNSTAVNVEVQFFYLSSELASLNAADGATASTLGAARQSGTTCQPNFLSANGVAQFLPQTANGTSPDGTVGWIKVVTPSFSNFFLQKAGLVLPTGLLSFSGEKAGAVNRLHWTTSQEQNNSGFEVQRSTDGINYTAIGFVNSQAQGGNSTSELNYTFIDNSPAGKQQYYRLRQVDIDSRSRLSNIVLIKGAKPTVITIGGLFPNPASESINVLVDAPSKDKVTLVVMDATGKSVLQKVVNVDAGSNTVPVDISRLGNGTYLVKLICASNCEMAVGKFVKQ